MNIIWACQELGSHATSYVLNAIRHGDLVQSLICFLQIFQFSGDADLNVRHSHSYSSEGYIYLCFPCSLGLCERFEYEVCYPIILIIPFIPTFPPPLAPLPSFLLYLASTSPPLVVADVFNCSLALDVSSSTWSGHDAFWSRDRNRRIRTGFLFVDFVPLTVTTTTTASSLSTTVRCIISLDYLSFLTLHRPR